MRKCNECGKGIKGIFYMSNRADLCEKCGDELLRYNGSIDCWVYEEDDRESYSDDGSVDLEKFDKVIE
jgi:uncharacterized Zn finger protein (UPF0148 family)